MRPGRIRDVVDLTKLSKATIHRIPDFPKPFHPSTGTALWDLDEVTAWLEERKAARITASEKERAARAAAGAIGGRKSVEARREKAASRAAAERDQITT